MEDITADDENKPSIRLKTGIELKDLISEKGATFEVNFEDLSLEEPQLAYGSEKLFDDFLNEDMVFKTYGDDCCPPFEEIAKQMVNVVDDGKIKKEVICPGSGEVLPKDSFVTINYNAYMEFNDEPFDSTYIRKKPHSFTFDDGTTIVGLDMAVQTMKINEKSRFLIAPELAYGKLGCMDRVQPDSTILFEIEVMNCIDSGYAKASADLSEKRQKDFSETYKYCLALCCQGNDKFTKGLYGPAIRYYNIAMGKLEWFQLKDYEEQKLQQVLLLRIRTNAVVTYTKLKKPKLACSHCNRIYAMCKDTDLRVPTKIYFNHARCLVQLNDLKVAEKYLKKAQALEPQNIEITQEFIKLNALRKQQREQERFLCKAMMGSKIDPSFEHDMMDVCKKFKSDKAVEHFLPVKLSPEERNFTEKCARECGLQIKDRNGDTFLFK